MKILIFYFFHRLYRSFSSADHLNDPSLRHEAHKITRSKSYHQRICGGCLRGEKAAQENTENGVLEAYDLASTGSPCCSAECVPSRRRRSHSHHGAKLKPSSSKTSLQSCNTNRGWYVPRAFNHYKYVDSKIDVPSKWVNV